MYLKGSPPPPDLILTPQTDIAFEIEVDPTKDVTDWLRKLLGTTIIETFKLYAVHWNTEGPSFYEHHKLYQEIYEEHEDGIDELAEQIRQLGEYAPFGVREAIACTCIPELDGPMSCHEYIKAVQADQEVLVSICQCLIEACERTKDQATLDLAVNRQRAHSKYAWFLRSYQYKNDEQHSSSEHPRVISANL